MGYVYLVQQAEKRSEPVDPGLVGIFNDPLRRALETAAHVATASGLDVQSDERLRGRMNFDGTQSMEEFLSEWARTVHDRGSVPRTGDWSNQTATRLVAFVGAQWERAGAVVAVTMVAPTSIYCGPCWGTRLRPTS
jgi:broad specificity phosphatase PhoE